MVIEKVMGSMRMQQIGVLEGDVTSVDGGIY